MSIASSIRPPGERDGEPITGALSAFGEDLLEHPDWYGSHDDQTMEQLHAALEGAATVRVYRAVPVGVTSIEDGDWVTLSRAYAHDHGWHEDDVLVMPVVVADVPVASVYTDGNDPMEWGYVGGGCRDLPVLREGDSEPPLGQAGGSADVGEAAGSEARRVARQGFPAPAVGAVRQERSREDVGVPTAKVSASVRVEAQSER